MTTGDGVITPHRPPRQQCQQRDGSAGHAHPGPAEGGIQRTAGQRAQPAACRVEQHVSGDHLCLRVRCGGQDPALIGDVQRLHGQIEQQHAQHQPAQMMGHRRDRRPAQQHQPQGPGGDPPGMAPVTPVPAAGRGQRTEHADQRESADGGVAEGIGWRAEWQAHAAPEHPEHGEQQQAQHAALAQHRLLPQQREQAGPRVVCGRHRQSRQPCPQQGAGHDHQHCREQVHRAPTAQIGHRPGHHPCQQQPDHHACLCGADHPATLVLARRGGGVGNQPLGHRGAEQAHRQHPQQQAPGLRGQRDGQQRQHQAAGLDRHQAAAVHAVAQRHDP